MRLNALRAKKASLVKECDAILNAAADREITAEESAAYEARMADIENLTARITTEEKLAEQLRSIEGVVPESVGNIGNPKPAFLDDPKKGFRSSQEFFRSVLDSAQSGRVADERLRFCTTAGSDEHGKYADPYGGFLVPSGFMPNLLSVAVEADPVAGLVTRIPMAVPSVKIPARTDKTHTTSVSGGLRVYRAAETQTVTASRMEVEQVSLDATPLMGLSYATEQLIRDSAISFTALIEAGFRDEFASKILYERIHGTGVSQLEGVLNAPCVVSVAKETGQAADTIVFENIIKMRARCWRYSNAVWLYNHDCLPQLQQMYIAVGTGGVPAWQMSAREGEPDMLLGRPAYPTEYCSTVGDNGDIILGVWSEYLEGTYQPLQSAESMHVRFEYNERAFRFTLENCGRVWWRSALTPKKSASTLSPFVTLAARA